MLFHSTNHRSPEASFREAVMQGLAPDGGLWMMNAIPRLSPSLLQRLPSLPLPDIALMITSCLLSDDMESDVLEKIVRASFSFHAPLKAVDDHTFFLELFHGPTLAFKDFGARFMARVMSHFAEAEGKNLSILVATSGDTGGAVAHAFHGIPHVRVFVLYPSGRVSDVQEKQFTTLGRNIAALEIDGTFDDCQRLVKEAFLDQELQDHLTLSSANSINVARLIPQSVYYFHAFAQLPDKTLPLVVSVPSGNFGNLTAGLIAKRMGLPVRTFIAATNANDVVPQYLTTGRFEPRPSIPTASNAMDVGNPSNFVRMLDLYDGSLERMRQDVMGFSFSDSETMETIRRIAADCHYLLDPHTAVGLLGWEKYQRQHIGKANGVILATAHPGKFPSLVQEAIGTPVAVPEVLASALKKKKETVMLTSKFRDLKDFLLSTRYDQSPLLIM